VDTYTIRPLTWWPIGKRQIHHGVTTWSEGRRWRIVKSDLANGVQWWDVEFQGIDAWHTEAHYPSFDEAKEYLWKRHVKHMKRLLTKVV
jgi:hypothetical protein